MIRLILAAFAAIFAGVTALAQTVATATWVGGGDRMNPQDPANWSCKDEGGSAIAGAIPTADTIVTISGETNFNLPAGTTLTAKRLVFDNVVLTADADWRGLVGGQTLTYTPVEYLYAPNGSHIDTTFCPNGNTRMKMDVEIQSPQYEYWWGIWEREGVWYNDVYCMCMDNKREVYAAYGNGGGGMYNGDSTLDLGPGLRVSVELNKNRASVIAADGTVCLDANRTPEVREFQLTYPIYLFKQNRAGTGFSHGGQVAVKMYSAQIWDDGALARDFVPAKDPNGVLCLVDRVSGAFYYNVGTGEFIGGAAGDPVEFKAGSQPISIGGQTVDTAGYRLTLSAGVLTTSGEAEVTSTVDGGEIEIATEADFELTGLALTGKLKLVKTGASSLTMVKTGQTYNGGTDVLVGNLLPKSDGWNGANQLFGANSTIFVDNGTTFDLRGGWDFGGYSFVVNGGTILNSKTKDWLDCGGVKNITLTADSNMLIQKQIGYNTDSTLNLGGYKMTYNGVADRHWWIGNGVIKNGTFDFQTGYINITTQQQKTKDSGSADLAFIWNGKLAVGRDFSVGNLTLGENAEYVADNLGALGKILVHGAFKPTSATFPTIEFCNGSTLDLTSQTGVFTPVGTMSEKETAITFAEAANVAIDVTGRGLQLGDKVIEWNEISRANFSFVNDQVSAVVKEDGLYYGDNSGETVVDRAVWTGAAHDGDFENPLNWACTDLNGQPVLGGIPGEETKVILSGATLDLDIPYDLGFLCDSVTITASTVLTKDCDLSGATNFAVSDGVTIDLQGHKLSVPRLAGTFTVTDSSAGEPGTLEVFLGMLQESTTQNVTLSGNLKLVKTGAGTLELIKENQTFTGGVEVRGGLVKPAAKMANFAGVIGPTANVVTVYAGGTFDLAGCYDYSGRSIVLAGGILLNTEWQEWPGLTTFGRLTLTEDSVFEVAQRYPLHGDRTSGYYDLGGKTLIANIARGTWNNSCLYIDGRAYFSNGTLVANGPLDICSDYEQGSQDMGSTDFSLVLNDIYTIERKTTVRDLTLGADATMKSPCFRGYDRIGYFKVHGVFTPNAANNHGPVEMQNGTTINLSQFADAFALESTVEGAAVTFAADAEITIDLTGRTLEPGTKILSWTTKPSATFKFLNDETIAASTSEGLFYGADPTSREVDHAVWTGAAESVDVNDPSNWDCYNAANVKIPEAVPGASARVTYDRPIFNLNIPSTSPLTCVSFTIAANTALSDDCDLTGVEKVTVGKDVVINTMGRTLTLGAFAGDFMVTNTLADVTGELKIVVPENATYDTETLALGGNLKITKLGAGTLSMSRPRQTFTGGLDVREGAVLPLAAAGYNESTKYSFGASRSTITIYEGGSFDMNGMVNYSNFTFVLAGGTITSSQWMNWPDYTSIGTINLTENSYINSAKRFSISDGGPAKINLNGKMLTVDAATDRADNYVWFNRCKAMDGTIYLRSGKLCVNAKEKAAKELDSGSEDLDVIVDGTWMLGRDMTVRNLTFNKTAGFGPDDSKNEGGFLVGGVFKALGMTVPTATLKNGAKIDVSENTEPLLLGSVVSFADGATVTLDWGSRKVAADMLLVAWDSKPANIDTLKFKTKSGWRVVVTDRGLFAKRAGFAMVIQ